MEREYISYGWGSFCHVSPALIEPCILAATRPGDFVLDPFFGSGTVGMVCHQHERRYVGIELHPAYVALAARRLKTDLDSIVKVVV